MSNHAAQQGCVFEQHLQPGTAVWGSPGRPGFPRWRRCWAAESAVLAAAAGAAAPYLSACRQTSPPKVRNSPEAAKGSETLDQFRSRLKNPHFIYQCKDTVNSRNFSKTGGGGGEGGQYHLCLKTVFMPVAFISKLTHRGHLPCIAEPGHIPKKGAQDDAADSESF